VVLQSREFVFSFLIQVVDEVDVVPRIVVVQDVLVERLALLTELDPGVAAHEAVVLEIRN
jgi:hypothetical protein